MSIEHMKELSSSRFDLAELPQKIELKPLRYEFKTDAHGRESLYVNFETHEGQTLTQKYTPMHFPDLVEIFEELKLDGGWAEITGKWVLFEQKKFRIGNPRLMPKKVLK